MKVRQLVYLIVTSETLGPAEIEARLGIAADESRARGTRHPGPPPIPRCHIWKLASGLPSTAPLDDYFTALLDRLDPVSDALAALIVSGEHKACVQVVRDFEPGPEDAAIIRARDAALPPGLEVLGGQHPLLGFHLTAEQLARLGSLGVSIDCDEYGDETE